MDVDTIDREYSQLQSEFQEVTQAFQTLAGKLQAAVKAGDPGAQDWLIDLKQVALQVKDEQVQTTSLLQAMHGFLNNTFQASQQANAYPPQQGYGYQNQQGMLGGMGGGGMGGMFGRFRGSGFARAMEMGAGIGLGEDIINSIF
ncbi:MAG: hypothetical protein ACRDY2_06925 [Acidimicrobiales bacterium]